jgi:hypothetical protein
VQTIAVAYANGKDFCAHDASWYSVWMLDVVSTASGSICYDPDITGGSSPTASPFSVRLVTYLMLAW